MNAHRLILIALLFTANLAIGKSSLVEVTQEKSKVAGFKVTLTSKRLPNGNVEFHAVVAEKKGGKFSSRPTTAVSLVEITETKTSKSQRVSPRRKVRHERKGNSLHSVFTVSPTELKNPNLCFTFANQVETIVDGKIRSHPSMLLLYARLADFAKQAVLSEEKTNTPSKPDPESQ